MVNRISLAITAGALVFPLLLSAARVNEPAPDFTATDTNGKVEHLADDRGKFVVLEWSNRECPWTHKQYASGNMQRLQKQWTAKGVVWFTVISSGPGNPGYVTAPEENAYMKQVNASPTAALLDPSGTLGHLYGAKTTPDMFIIDPKGILIYEGAIDDHYTIQVSDIPISKNYVDEALTEATAGKPVSIPVTRPYGCSVKYADQ